MADPISDLLSQAKLVRRGKTAQYLKPGSFMDANADFYVLAGDCKIREHGNSIRSVELTDGTTISVRPSSAGGFPTIQINNPAGKTIKIRYG